MKRIAVLIALLCGVIFIALDKSMDLSRFKSEKVLASYGLLVFLCLCVVGVSAIFKLLKDGEKGKRLKLELQCFAVAVVGLFVCGSFKEIKLYQWAQLLGSRSREIEALIQEAVRECGGSDESNPSSADCIKIVRKWSDVDLQMKSLSRVYRSSGCRAEQMGSVLFFETSIEGGLGVYSGCEEKINTSIKNCRYVDYRSVSKDLFVFIAQE